MTLFSFDAKTEDNKTLAKMQCVLINNFLKKSRVQFVDEILSITDMNGIPKDILLANLDVAIPYKPKLCNFAPYVNGLAIELASRGYAPKVELKRFL